MAARASSRAGGYAGNDRLAMEAAAGPHPPQAERAGAAAVEGDDDSVARLLSSLDRLGARIRALTPAADGEAPPPPSAATPRSTSADLQRAIEQIARKRDSLDRSPARRPSPPGRQDADFADIGARVLALSQAGARPQPARAPADADALAGIRDDLAALRAQFDEMRTSAPEIGLVDAVEEIGSRLAEIKEAVDNPPLTAELAEQLAEVRQLIAAVPTEAHFQAIADRLDAFADHLSAGPADGQALTELGRGVAELADIIVRLDRRELIDDIAGRVGDIAKRIVLIEGQLNGFGEWREAAGRQTTLMSQIAQRVEQVPRLAHELERQAGSVERIVEATDALPRLMADLDAIRRSLEQDGRAGDLAAIAERIDALTHQVEDSRAAAMVADGTLERRIADLLAHVDSLSGSLDATAIAAIDAHFCRLDATIEAKIRSAAASAPLPEQLVEALGRIEAHLADGTARERLCDLEQRIAALTQSLNGFDFATAGDVAAIEHAISALGEELRTTQQQADERVDEAVRALTTQIDGASLPAMPAEALAAIEARIGEIAGRLDGRPGELAALAEALERLETTVTETLSADAIAQRLAALPGRAGAPDPIAAAALEGKIVALREELIRDGRRDRDLLVAIGETVERLARREIEAIARPAPSDGGSRRTPPPASADSQSWRDIETALAAGFPGGGAKAATEAPVKPAGVDPEPAEEPAPIDAAEETRPAGEKEPAEDGIPSLRARLFSRKPRAKPAVAAPPARQESDFGANTPPAQQEADLPARQEADFDVNTPLAPGSGKPPSRPAAAEADEPPRTETAAVAGGRDEAAAVPSKADFIAAARRAAMAASTEPSRPHNGSASASRPRLGLPHFDLAVIARHKRQLMMGAVAVAVAFGSLNIGAKLWRQFATPAPAAETSAAAPAALPSTHAALPQARQPASPVMPAAAASALSADPTTAAPGFSATISDLSADSFSKPAGGGTALAAADLTGSLAPAPAAGPTPTPAAVPMPPEAVGPLALRQAAADGDRIAQFEIASRLAEGRGLPADLAGAVTWFRHAAEAGLAPAQYRLGSLYEKGQGTARNLKEAADWYAKAAAQGNVKAMHNLAVLNAEGGLGEPDYPKAARLFKQAADLGVRDSQFNLGILYARGLGVPRDLTSSYKWFAIAANGGDGDSAKKRDDVAQVLSREDLARARLAVETWTAKPLDRAANEVPVDNPAWTAAPEHTASVDETRLVMKAQSFLAAQGFDPGPADGRMGKRTREAISAYQKARGLPVTGEIDQALIAAIGDDPA